MDQRWVDLARVLRGLGMWDNLPEADAEAAQQLVADGRYPFVARGDDLGIQYFYVDSEAMAEGGVGDALAEMAPGLRACGLELTVANESRPPRADDGDYVITISGRPCVVWTPQDWLEDPPWEAATVRPLAVVNDLLADAGCTRRLYTINVGTNDATAWLLDPRIVAAVAGSGLVDDKSMPSLASHV